MSSRRRSGLTLIELIVVLVIISLAIALVVPRLGGIIASTGLDAAHARVVDTLTVARGVATQRGSRLTLIYARKTIRIVVEDGGEADPMTFPLPERTRLVSVTIGDARIDLSRKTARIRFRPDGLCLDHSIVIASDDDGQRRTLTVEGLTGRITVQEGQDVPP